MIYYTFIVRKWYNGTTNWFPLILLHRINSVELCGWRILISVLTVFSFSNRGVDEYEKPNKITLNQHVPKHNKRCYFCTYRPSCKTHNSWCRWLKYFEKSHCRYSGGKQNGNDFEPNCIYFQTSINELDRDDDMKYGLFPGFQQRDRQPLPAILPPHDDIFQDADESQPLTSESQQNTPQHTGNQMMVTPAVSHFIAHSYLCLWFGFFLKFRI